VAKERKTLDDLFHDTLRDIYFAEKKILVAVPKMAKAAQSTQLKKAFEKHHGETEVQVRRLEQVFGIIDRQPNWGRLVASTARLDEFRQTFGDERAEYDQALQGYYKSGAPADWPEHFITGYATAHPWEDFARREPTISIWSTRWKRLPGLAWSWRRRCRRALLPASTSIHLRSEGIELATGQGGRRLCVHCMQPSSPARQRRIHASCPRLEVRSRASSLRDVVGS
jgi:ferritin-like metal-binding protein YciE